MIEINLVPEHLRKKKRSQPSSSGEGSNLNVKIVGSTIGLIFCLICAHVIMQFFINEKFNEHKEYTARWQKILPHKNKADEILKIMKEIKEKVASVEGAVNEKEISWASKLNIISDSLPRGVWLMRVSLDGEVLIVQGSAVSKTKIEMINVHNFTSELKQDDSFMDHFQDIDLGLIKSRKVDGTQVADFTLTAELK